MSTRLPSTEQTPPYVPMTERARPGVNPWLIRLPILFTSGLILLVIVLAGALLAYQSRYQNAIFPGMSAYGLDLSGMTVDQAAAALDAQFSYDTDAVFTFRDGERFWQLTAGELGVSFDAQATAQQAFEAGHSANPLQNVAQQASMWLNGRSVSPVVTYDQGVAISQLAEIAGEINVSPVDAQLTVAGTMITSTPAQYGRTLDTNATLRSLDAVILNLNSGGEIPLIVLESPPTIVDAETAAERARAAMSGTVTLVVNESAGGALGPWYATADQIGNLLSTSLVTGEDGSLRYDVQIDMVAFQGFLETLAPGLIMSKQDARFHFDDATSQLQVIQPSVSGRTLDIEGTLARLERGIFSRDQRIVPLAFHYEEPLLHSNVTAAELGITQLVSEATTYYAGSTAARRQNIATAAARFDGIIIPPGGEFSYNYWLGDVSPEAGFEEGFIISGGRTIKGVGGGVCQVSTTAFQAAFYAGFPILERYAHGYRVGYYEAGEGTGMDAAIYTPDLDFRFLNDTPYHLLIESYVFPASDMVQFKFYSTNPGRQVVKQGPVVTNQVPAGATVYEENPSLLTGQTLQVDWAVAGADVTVERVILDMAGNEIGRDRFFSHYLPWSAVIQVAPGEIPAGA